MLKRGPGRPPKSLSIEEAFPVGPTGIEPMAPMASTFGNRSKVELVLIILIAIIAIISLVFAILCYTNETFANTVFGNKQASLDNLKDLDVLLFFSPDCPYCKKTMSLFDKTGAINDVKPINVSTEDGQKLAIMYGATEGVPAFYSRKRNTGVFGHRDDITDIVNALNGKNLMEKKVGIPEVANTDATDAVETGTKTNASDSIEDRYKRLGVVLFYRNGCSWCNKAKQDLENTGMMVYTDLKDANSTDGMNAMKDYGIDPTSGVPVFASKATKKSTIGYKQIKDIVSSLE